MNITSYNSPADEFGDFGYRIEGDKMFWTRTEEGMEVEVELQRIEQLPAGYTDELRGLWELKDSEGTSPYLKAEGLSHLFVRWDGKYFLYRSDGRTGGVYNVRGHQAEVELIPYVEELDRSWWTFSRKGEALWLELLNTEDTVSRTFVRALEFPEN
ncbi:hypothetical protein CEQ90_09155 [Lewinellaceae bacterium SD302]|nr:hypothetical protein CEQ90_09155 [Lewinellaceae bacterium SD302]